MMLIVSFLSVFGCFTLGQEKVEPFLAFNSLFAEFIIRTESSGMSIEGIGAIFEDNLKGVDSFAVFVQVVAQIH